MASHNDLGKRGEEAVIDMLDELNYTILEHNWSCKYSEIDIIACNEEWILFVEVKTRTSDKWGNPESAVSEKKIRRIVDAADYYVREHDIDLQIRFDVAAVIVDNNKLIIDYIEDAFLSPLM